jgi:hypothetical protein
MTREDLLDGHLIEFPKRDLFQECTVIVNGSHQGSFLVSPLFTFSDLICQIEKCKVNLKILNTIVNC